MTAATAIKLTPAMEKALAGAQIGFSPNFGVATGIVAPDTKTQTVKALHARGLADLSGALSPEGVEAAIQLGQARPEWKAPGTPLAAAQIDQEISEGIITPHPDRVPGQVGSEITPEMIDEAARSLAPAVFGKPQKAVDLDKPIVVPNRKDKRKARFSLRSAYSRMVERKRARKVAKYGQTNYTGEVNA